ncbi:kinase-like protein [Panus rudis PR-1116 ss-1]|nr:kinase-like protein [Panus rudis PR-1116 ss-1]
MIYSDAVAWATLRHPNVLHVIGAYHLNLIGPPRTEHLLALPWLRNRNVSIHIRYIEEELHEQPPLSEWVSQIASALEYLHREGIVHGGMRTSAVMIDDDNIVKLTDYGTEKYIVREDAVSESAAASEPHEWYPPERYRVAGHKAVATSASDIYGFGCIWLHLHSRRIPFYDISEDEDVEPYRIRGVVVSWPIDGLKPPHTLEELHSLEAWHFVRRCLAENPSRRPKAGELQQVAKFDTLWIRQVYSEPEPVDPNRKPNLSPIPFKPPSLYRYFMYRMYLHLRAARKAARSLLARFVPNSQSVAAGRLVSSPAVD